MPINYFIETGKREQRLGIERAMGKSLVIDIMFDSDKSGCLYSGQILTGRVVIQCSEELKAKGQYNLL